MAASWPLSLLIGFVAGYLSGQFGIGGGIITTPALRLLLGAPELVAVGTPLPVIIPTAVAGVISYARKGLIDVRVGLTAGLIGGAFSVAGAWAADFVGGDIVLVLTALLIVYVAGDMALLALRPERPEHAYDAHVERRRSPLWLGLLGMVAGLYSGFLGLGGGFVVVPVLVRFFAFPMKRAVGTSLVAVTVFAIPGTITHYLLGNIDVGMALALSLGVVPGALLGAHVTAAAKEKTVRLGFAAMLLAVGLVLGLTEAGIL